MSLENPDNYDNIYQVGGSLPVHASTYVRRLADQNLYEGLLAGNFCYVLNSRQMGKSSLRVQTMKRLQEAGIICTAIDLTSIGSQDITPEQWYAGIIYSLASGLELLDKFNLGEWWQDHQFLTPLQRLGQFFSEIVLREIQGKIVIFIDEIDSVLSLSFNVDDFFGLIRSCYQKDSDYERLTFVMLGVASPADLIRNKNINNNFNIPFNIGQAIDLQGFQLSEALPLVEGLKNIFERPEEILRDILDWTGGQPFLTQKVCKLVSKYGQAYSENIVSNVVQEKIIKNWEGQDEPEHLKTIRDRLLYSSKNRDELLELYHQILQKEAINDQNLPQYTELRLTGLVVKQNGKLKVYNRIYAEVFNLWWLRIRLKSYSKNLLDIDQLSPIEESDDHTVSFYHRRGSDYYNNGDYYRAISDFEQIIRINPFNAIAYNNRGRCFLKLGKYQEALDDYNKAIEIEPNFVASYNGRGDINYRLQDYQTAMIDYNKTIELDPNYFLAYRNRGNIYYNLKKYEMAIGEYNTAITIKPNDAVAYNRRGMAFYHLYDYKKAITDYDRAIAIDRSYSEAYLNRGIARHYLEGYGVAVHDYVIAMKLANTEHSKYDPYQEYSFDKEDIVHKEDMLFIDNKLLNIFEFEIPIVNSKGKIIKQENKQAKYFTERLPGNLSLDMVEIPGGSFIMGSPKTEIGRHEDEGPQHEVTIKTFYMGKYPITQAQYEAVMGLNPSKFTWKNRLLVEILNWKQTKRFCEILSKLIGKKYVLPSEFTGKNRPVETVDWHDAKYFCTILSKLTGKKYVLPSEAQWEYAARAGTTTAFHYGETITSQLANYASGTYNHEKKGKWRKKTTDVGIFPPNAFGLYDIHGNVWEWCEDNGRSYEENLIDDNILSESTRRDGDRILRGGSWYSHPVLCRVATRNINSGTIRSSRNGFRVCCLIENTD